MLAAAALAAASTAHAGAPAKAGRRRRVRSPSRSRPIRCRRREAKLLHTLIRVVNPNDYAVTVMISGRALALGDDGKVSIGAGPDPRWAGRVRFPRGAVRIPAQGWRDVTLTVGVPRRL